MAQKIREKFPISNHWLVEEPSKFLPFEFENSFTLDEARVWALDNLSLIKGLCVIYFLFAQIGPSFMKNRKAINLQIPLALWNFLLAFFSITATVRMMPIFFDILQQPDGLYNSCCVRKGLSQPAVFWGIAFAVSKLFEFGDTVFIVLRKRPLKFIHWFHHVTMLYGCTIGVIEAEPISSWIAFINYSVHSIMYSYYTIMALKFRIPKKISMAITSLQILQLAIGIFVNIYTIGVLANGGACARTPFCIRWHLSIGTIYFGLFANYFYKSYIANPKKKSA